jgi:tRNA(Ile)-lysidine synthase
MNITELLKVFIKTDDVHKLKYIVAVSGGIDSMVLLHLCKAANLSIVAAHCNFSLRGDESLGDENFVRDFCTSNQIPADFICFNTKKISEELGKSTQETARILRYNWFDELVTKYQADYILTAHHANDLAETFLFNLVRGSGIKGLSSIPGVNSNIIRPMLMQTQHVIRDYASIYQIPFRTDSSNLSDDYSRNFIRHHIIPKLTEVNQQAIEHIASSTQILKEAQQIIDDKINDLKTLFYDVKNNVTHINIRTLKNLSYYPTILHTWLNPMGFNSTQINEILSSNLDSGKEWLSSSHQLIFNRDELLIRSNESNSENQLIFESNIPDVFSFNGYNFHVDSPGKDSVNFDETSFYFDADKLQFPLTIRSWLSGDFFRPLGMKNNKKLSNFFIDKKINLFQKSKSVVIRADKNIVAVLPYQIDDKYKITADTKQVLRIRLA